jgi:uncharacterized membrane protein YphA (DoxX/SURF4 family)
MDVGLLILRSVLGFILFVHGMQKAKGWFGVNRPGTDGDSNYWIATRGWSVRCAS